MLTIKDFTSAWADAVKPGDANERKDIAERWNAYYSYLAAQQNAVDYKADPDAESLTEFMLREGIVKYTDKIIDIGAGTGRYSIELAKRCSSVTALDANEDSLELLKKYAWQTCTSNLACIPIHWEDFNIESRTKKYDVAFSSMCPAICTFEEMERMEKICRRTVCLVSAARGSYEKHRREIMQRLNVKPRGMTTESIYYYNVLYLSGRNPNVKSWTSSHCYEMDWESFRKRYCAYAKVFDIGEDETVPVLEKYFSEKAENGVLLEECRMNMTMIWWRVPEDER